MAKIRIASIFGLIAVFCGLVASDPSRKSPKRFLWCDDNIPNFLVSRGLVNIKSCMLLPLTIS